MTPRIAIGIGCRRNCAAETIAALVRRALELACARLPSAAFAGEGAARLGERRMRASMPSGTLPHPPSLRSGTFSRMREKDGASTSLFTSQAKAGENGLVRAAAILGMELIPLSQAELEASAPRCVTHSERVEALLGLPSLAEAAALAGAGPHSRLILARISEGGASCAVAMPEAVALPEGTTP